MQVLGDVIRRRRVECPIFTQVLLPLLQILLKRTLIQTLLIISCLPKILELDQSDALRRNVKSIE